MELHLEKESIKKKQNVQYGFHLQWQYRFLVFYFLIIFFFVGDVYSSKIIRIVFLLIILWRPAQKMIVNI